jgi:hypothetical protein
MIISMFYGVIMIYQEKERKFQNQWEEIQVEKFICEISRKQECTENDFLNLSKLLNYGDVNTIIHLELYQREQSLTGIVQYYYFSWDEIREILYSSSLKLERGSIVCIESERNVRKLKQKKVYCEIIAGKD